METVTAISRKIGPIHCTTLLEASNGTRGRHPNISGRKPVTCKSAPARFNRSVALGTLAVVSQGVAALAAVAATAAATPEPGGLGGLIRFFQTGDVDCMSHIQQFILVAGPFGLAPGLVSSPLLLLGIVKEGKVPKEKVLTSTRNALIGWVVLTLALSLAEDFMR
eukprot:jgi/Mesvir1/23741/Mv18680-RA.1